MKKFIIILVLIITCGCQDVIELDLNEAPPRLVINATIELKEDGSTSSLVRLSRSVPFFQEDVIPVTDATIIVTDATGAVFTFNHTMDGFYENTTLQVSENTDYTLEITDGADTYTATQQLVLSSPIVNVEQEEVNGIDDLTQIILFYNEPAGLGDYYLFEYVDEFNTEVEVQSDEFIDGNLVPETFFMEDLEDGQLITLRIKGINEPNFAFYETLIQQTDSGAGGPFDTQPATVRGNIINTVNVDEFPFGYFRISEVFEAQYIFIAP